ncbi:MAG TPA: phosphatase PAP2 family protein [Clostridia bacterium]|nr:phosphatase PAP2 family protein [Clostridia bacterium]
MEFLKLLQQARTPFFTGLFSALTYLGDELVFMATVLVVLWCVNKKWGYRLFAMGMMGTILNQILKAIFLIPRPWVLDNSFKPVESALESAGGYSFPSGHTQSAATLFGGIAAWLKKRWATVVAILLVLITAFSRMYLGVHTPLDVGVSLATGLFTVLLFAYLFEKAEKNPRVNLGVSIAVLVGALILLLYVLLAPKTERNVAQFDAEGLKTAYTVFGTVIGLVVSWFIDSRYIRYETRAAWWAQILKFVLGLGLVAGIRAGLKAPLLALFQGHGAADCLRYFLMTVTGGVVWPLTFRFFAKTAQK